MMKVYLVASKPRKILMTRERMKPNMNTLLLKLIIQDSDETFLEIEFFFCISYES